MELLETQDPEKKRLIETSDRHKHELEKEVKSISDKTERVVKNVIIPANRGNVYSVKGNLLATSIPKYDIRLDAITPTSKTFEKYIKPLCDSLSKYSGKSSSYYQNDIRRARALQNRYYLIARKNIYCI